MKKFLKGLLYGIAAVYPILVFSLLVIFKIDTKVLSLCIILLGFTFFISATGNKKIGNGGKRTMEWRPFLSSILFLSAGLFCFITGKDLFLKLYSVVISVTFLFTFGSTLFFEPTIIFRFATLADKSIIGSPYENQVKRYCKNVTIIWCCFFIFNGSMAAYTTFCCSKEVWAIYNGGISYVLMGLLFAVEFLVRKLENRKMVQKSPITKFNADSRKDDYIMCYDGLWSQGNYKTWKDFLVDVAKMRAYLEANNTENYVLHCEDNWYFMCTFIALLQCKKSIYITQTISENYMAEILNPETEFLTDQTVDASIPSIFIPDLIEKGAMPSETEIRKTPAISGDNSKIYLYTSGSTGKPKAILHNLDEIEKDNQTVISLWGDEYFKRKLITTVSQHHIYGFYWCICLPFTIGVPFRRKRVEFPSEFEDMTDTSYVLVSTPSFIKRTVEVEESLNMKDIFISTSGGALSEELAVKAEKLFGFCPMEGYGSTETSGIGYRQQSRDGLWITPYDCVEAWIGENGCLNVKSPFISDPNGFATSDLAEIREDGKILLKGRSDSIVKIEEKRISMTEVENRLYESGLVQDVSVVALTNDVRQYLAAVIVFNEEGKKKFENMEKLAINRYFHDFLMKYFENVVIPKKWRFVEKIPTDVQGKKHKLEIIAMFGDK